LLVGGTGTAEPLMKLLIEVFNKQAPDVNVKVVSPPLGSSGGAKALLAGRIDLAVISRPLKAEEKAILGRHFVIGTTPFVLATNGGLRRNGFTPDELAGVYEGRLQTWDTGAVIRLVLRTRDDSDTHQLMAMSPAMDKAVRDSDQRQGMVFGNDDLDTLQLITRTPGSLGPTSLGLLKTTDSRLAVLAINGVTPSVATLKNGRYPWSKELIVVLPSKASPAAEKFADFLRSGKAGAVLLRYDYLPTRP
jgi:phosphate transport system substrate-binding protein